MRQMIVKVKEFGFIGLLGASLLGCGNLIGPISSTVPTSEYQLAGTYTSPNLSPENNPSNYNCPSGIGNISPIANNANLTDYYTACRYNQTSSTTKNVLIEANPSLGVICAFAVNVTPTNNAQSVANFIDWVPPRSGPSEPMSICKNLNTPPLPGQAFFSFPAASRAWNGLIITTQADQALMSRCLHSIAAGMGFNFNNCPNFSMGSF